MKKIVIVVFIFICMFFSSNRVLAGRGCCSHHGGQAYCSDGRWVCNDGTYSPTCTCSGGSSSSGSSYYKKSVRTTTVKKIYGCTNSNAINYSSNANVSDGSCRFERIETSIEKYGYETVNVGDKTGEKKEVITQGKDGEKKIVKRIITNELGEEVSTELISEEIIKEPTNEVIKYVKTENFTMSKDILNEKAYDGQSNNIIILEIILIAVAVLYSNKNKNANTIINKIKKTRPLFKIILYLLYFILVLPPFADIILMIINEIILRKSEGSH